MPVIIKPLHTPETQEYLDLCELYKELPKVYANRLLNDCIFDGEKSPELLVEFLLKHEKVKLWVGRFNGRIITSLASYFYDENIVEVAALTVRKSSMGRGVASRIFTYVYQQLKSEKRNNIVCTYLLNGDDDSLLQKMTFCSKNNALSYGGFSCYHREDEIPSKVIYHW